eukprot:5801207-Amphidinium_carterae.1
MHLLPCLACTIGAQKTGHMEKVQKSWKPRRVNDHIEDHKGYATQKQERGKGTQFAQKHP